MEYTWENRWRKGEQGEDIMPEIQARFLEWLLSDVRVPPSQAAWCRDNDVDEKTPARWKKDPRFIRAWEAGSAEKNVSIERVQAVIDVIYAAAVDGDLKAAEQYMRYVERILPPKKLDRDPEDLATMSDAELIALAQSLADGEDDEPAAVAAKPAPRVEAPAPKLQPVSSEALQAMLNG